MSMKVMGAIAVMALVLAVLWTFVGPQLGMFGGGEIILALALWLVALFFSLSTLVAWIVSLSSEKKSPTKHL